MSFGYRVLMIFVVTCIPCVWCEKMDEFCVATNILCTIPGQGSAVLILLTALRRESLGPTVGSRRTRQPGGPKAARHDVDGVGPSIAETPADRASGIQPHADSTMASYSVPACPEPMAVRSHGEPPAVCPPVAYHQPERTVQQHVALVSHPFKDSLVTTSMACSTI